MITIPVMDILVVIGAIAILFVPVIWIRCIKPGKTLQEGLREWIEESEEDI